MSRCTRPFERHDRKDIGRKLTGSREVVLRHLGSAGGIKRRRYKAFLKECRFELVREVFLECGATEVDSEGAWAVAWIDGALPMEFFSKMKAHQRINHFPGMGSLCRKDLLASNLNRMRALMPQEYDFFPLTFCLPQQSHKLVEHCQGGRRGRKEVFILKPDTSCQGSGIEIVKGVRNIQKYRNVVCQRYISAPLLMDTFKFDLRLYVLVTSVSPLRVYAYGDGLVRLATLPYQKPGPSNMQEKRMHLTNYAINRQPEDGGSGEWQKINCKRSFSELEALLESMSVDRERLWSGIDALIVKTLLSALPSLRHLFRLAFPLAPLSPCFEILGFDVLLAQHTAKPHLIEVNRSPSLSGSSAADVKLKKGLVRNALDMVLPTPRQISLFSQEQRKKSVWRLTQPGTDRQPTTARERLVAEEQERREVRRMGRFRRLFPHPIYDPILRTIEDAI